MSPVEQTIYAIGLFSALATLWLWSSRRRRVSQMVSRAVRSMNQTDTADDRGATVPRGV